MIIAHYQDGPAQGRCEALREKEPPTYRDIPFFPPTARAAPALALATGVTPPPPSRSRSPSATGLSVGGQTSGAISMSPTSPRSSSLDTLLSSLPKHVKVDLHFRTEVALFTNIYTSRTNRKAAMMAHFEAVVMPQLRVKALAEYLRGMQRAGVTV